MRGLKLMAGAAVLLVSASLVPASAQAAVLFQSVPDFNIDASNMLASSRPDQTPYRVYDIFTLAGAATLNSVTFAVQTVTGVPSTISVGIYAVSADGLPSTGSSGTLLSSNVTGANLSTVSTYTSDEDSDYDTTTVQAILPSTRINAGRYYISFYNAAGLSIPVYDNPGSSVYQSGLTGFYRNVSSGFRIEGTLVATAVPEPATWGMMMVGFTMLAGILRRRRVTVRFA